MYLKFHTIVLQNKKQASGFEDLFFIV